MEVNIARVKLEGGSWKVSCQFKGREWARFYHYLADAQTFKAELEAATDTKWELFTPEAYHMYERG